jgi:hypothetical protein
MDGSNVYVFQFFMYAVLSGQWLSFLCCSLRLCMMSDLRVLVRVAFGSPDDG